jgi:hypothetical protein
MIQSTTGLRPHDWYVQAARAYVEQHQGCPSCDRQHCVFRSVLGNRIEYYCSICDFAVCRDQGTGVCIATPGKAEAKDPTLIDIAL